MNKRQRTPKGKLKMDNLEKLATLGTQVRGRRQTKQKNTRPQYASKHKY